MTDVSASKFAIVELANWSAPSQRRKLLASTAFAGGVFALMLLANPQSAVAACTVTALPNTVSCATTTTTNTVNLDAATLSSSDREHEFDNGGLITPGTTGFTVNTGATVNGYGLAIVDSTAAGANVVNNGTVTLTTGDTPTVGGPAGSGAVLDVESAGGNVLYAGNGAVNDNGQGVTALAVRTVGSGSASVGTPQAPINATISSTGGDGIYVASENGNSSVYLTGGTVTQTGSEGAAVFVNTATNLGGTGAAIIQTTGNTTITGPSGGWGLVAGATSGGVSITTDANISTAGAPTNRGIIAQNSTGAGAVTVIQTGGTVFATTGTLGGGIGIGAANFGIGGVSVTTAATSTLSVTGAGSIGILAEATGTAGGINVTSAGIIDPPDTGIQAVITNSANASNVNVSVTGGSVTANDIGIQASTAGTGGVNVITLAGTVINQGNGVDGAAQNGNVAAPLGGIVTSATTGTTSINVGGAIAANSYGINSSETGAGAINITTGAGNISSTTASAISATSAGGAVSVTTGTGLVSGTTGIVVDATSGGTATGGTVTIAVGSGGVTGTGGNAITTTANTGFTSITTAGLVTATNAGNGINATATTGNITIAAGGDVTSAAAVGINASTSAGGAIAVSTSAGTTVSGATGGISATVTGGTTNGIIVTANGNVSATGTGAGISASIDAGTGNVQVSGTGSAIGMGAGTSGVLATTGGTGGVTVNLTGVITDTGGGSEGITAIAAGGNVLVATGNNVTGGTNGIHASTSGSGTVTVSSTLGTVIGTANDGIIATSVNGLVSVVTAAVTGGVTGIDATSTSGPVTVAASGNVSGGTGDGIIAGGGTSGNVSVGVTNGSTVSGGTGIAATSTGGTGTTVTVDTSAGGLISASAGAGIVATSSGGSSVSVNAASVSGFSTGIDAESGTGNVAATTTVGSSVSASSAVGGFNGILAEETSAGGTGNVTVVTGGTVTGGNGGNGISAIDQGSGNVTVNASAGLVTSNADAAINALATSGRISVTAGSVTGGIVGIFASTSAGGSISVSTSGTVLAGSSGIQAEAGGATGGSVTVITTGPVTGGAGAGDFGIDATTASTGSSLVSVAAGGNVSAAIGINAQATGAGSGAVTVTDTANTTITGTNTFGVNATSAGSGSVSVAVANVTGATTAINASSATGSVGVTTTGNVTGTGGDGIAAAVTGAGGGGVSITTGGTVGGSTNGIVATTAGTATAANVYVNSTIGTVTGTAGEGITATSVSGQVSVVTAAVTGGTNGIDATSTSGPVSVTTSGTITGGTTGTNAGIVAGGAVGGTGTTGAVTVSTLVGSNVSGGIGIAANASGPGAITITTNGTVIGTTGDAIDVDATGTGAVTVQTFGALTAGATGDAIDIHGGGTGAVLVHTYVQANGDPSIIVNMGGNVDIITDASSPTTGATVGISGTTTGATSHVNIEVSAAVIGQAGDGIFSSSVGGPTTVTVRPNVIVTGTGSGNSGIAANTATGAITVANYGTATNTTGIGVSLTQTGAGSAVLNNESGASIVGLGTSTTNPVININSTTGPTTINNLAGALIASASGSAGDLAIQSGAASAGGPVTVNNASSGVFASGLPQFGLIGRVALSGAAGSTNLINNQSGGTWTLFGANSLTAGTNTILNQSMGFNGLGGININYNPITQTTLSGGTATTFTFAGTATSVDTVANYGLINSAGAVSFLGLENIVNTAPGVFNVGSAAGVLGEQTNFSSGATPTTAGPQAQTAFNSGTYNVQAVQSQAGTYRGSLNFFGAAGSTFTNTNAAGTVGGIINMQADGGKPNNAVTLGVVSMGGTSDPNYAYVFGPAYNFMGTPTTIAGQTTTPQPSSQLWVDTQLGAPGSTSDRLVVSGTVGGLTEIKVNDVDTGPGAYNPVGITVVKTLGGGSATAFNVAPTTPNYVAPNNLYSLGAVQKGAFVYPLIYNTANDPAYQFFGLPGPFLAQTTAFASAAQNIFSATADSWNERQEETRNCMRRGFAQEGQAYGGGTDLPTKDGVELPQCQPGVWTKLIGSWANVGGTVNLGQLNPLFGGVNYDTSYRQQTGGALVGVDFGFTELTSEYDSLVFTLMGGYLTSMANFNSPGSLTGTPGAAANASLGFNGGTVGASATYINRGFFIDALLKADLLALNVGNIPVGLCSTTLCSETVYSTTWGTVDNVGYRFEMGRYFIEPLGSLEWSRTNIGNLSLAASAVTVQFGNADWLNLGGGARAGGVIMDDRTHYLEASVTGRVWDDVAGRNTVTFANLGPTFGLSDNIFTRPFGEAGLQFDWLNRYSGWSAFLQADARFNDQFQIYTGKAGLRYAF